MPRMKYFISSNLRYYKTTVPMILRSLSGQLKPRDIVLTVSGCSSLEIDFGVETFCVPYNSFEYTSLINLVEIDYEECEYAFLLHDTMVCGESFKRLSSRFEREKVNLAHEKGWCNLGAYPVKLLQSQRDRFLDMKNMAKRRAIEIEGKLFPFSTYKNPTCANLNRKFRYEKTDRHTVYFNSVDVYKFGSNNGQLFKDNIINNEL